jgi:hypothetical protein
MKSRKPETAATQQAEELTGGAGGRQYTPCPYGCGSVRQDKLARHLKRNHTNSPGLISKARSAKVDLSKRTDALSHSVSGGRPESNRRTH